MRRELVGVAVRLGDDREWCESSIETAGGYVVVVESMLAVCEVLLVSSYLAGLSGRTAVSHLALIGVAPAEFSQRMVERMPGQTHARACLLDHAAVLQRALGVAQKQAVSVEISDAALATWRPPAMGACHEGVGGREGVLRAAEQREDERECLKFGLRGVGR